MGTCNSNNSKSDRPDQIEGFYHKKEQFSTFSSKDESQSNVKTEVQNHKKEDIHNNHDYEKSKVTGIGIGEGQINETTDNHSLRTENVESYEPEERPTKESVQNSQEILVKSIECQDRQFENEQICDTEVKRLKLKDKPEQNNTDVTEGCDVQSDNESLRRPEQNRTDVTEGCDVQSDNESLRRCSVAYLDKQKREKSDLTKAKKKKTKKAKIGPESTPNEAILSLDHHHEHCLVDNTGNVIFNGNLNADEYVDSSPDRVHKPNKKKKRTGVDILANKNKEIKDDDMIKHMSYAVERIANHCKKDTFMKKDEDDALSCCPQKFTKNLRFLEQHISELQSRNKQLDIEKNDYLNRLSSVAGAQLLNNNPNIANLGDQNRPTKLAEEFSKLYDDEWTDAYEMLIKIKILPETAIYYLYGTLKAVYETCKQKSDLQLYGMAENLFLMNNPSSEQIKSMLKTYTYEHKKMMDFRKETAGDAICMIQQTICHDGIFKQKLDESRKQFEERILGKIFETQYFKRCVELCWMMVIQDPPMYIETTYLAGTQIDKESYKEYTKSGSLIQYVVWPALYLFKDDKLGPLMSKGVVQPM